MTALVAIPLLAGLDRRPVIAQTFYASAAVLAIALLRIRKLAWHCSVEAKTVHYVQFIMQGCIYSYWGYYWQEVRDHVPLIAAQILFAYLLEMTLSWSQGRIWIIGFGPIPVVLSTNLFLSFRDEWFFLQFLMIGTAVLSKDLIRWQRGSRLTHIFNPSAFGLFCFSLGVILTQNTDVTWAREIANTLAFPPKMYLAIFLVGLVVQSLFSVTLVTLSAAIALCALNAMYTGIYSQAFITSLIPVPVFLGFHLLVTDPATSPRSNIGRTAFGALYGIGVFGVHIILSWIGAPHAFDKLLFVPTLNLSVRLLDQIAPVLEQRFARFRYTSALSARRKNLAHMAVWTALFVCLMLTGLLRTEPLRSAATPHPSRDSRNR